MGGEANLSENMTDSSGCPCGEEHNIVGLYFLGDCGFIVFKDGVVKDLTKADIDLLSER